MIPAIALMLAAYMIPRIILAAMAFSQQAGPDARWPHVAAWLLCAGSVGVVFLGLLGVMISGVPTGLK